MQALIRPAAACRRDAVIALGGLASGQDAEEATDSLTTTADPAAFYPPVGAAVLVIEGVPVSATTTTTLVPTMTLRAEWYDGGWVEFPVMTPTGTPSPRRTVPAGVRLPGSHDRRLKQRLSPRTNQPLAPATDKKGRT